MFEFWFQIPSKTCTPPFAHIASGPQTSPVFPALLLEPFFGTTDVYELCFSYLSISVFNSNDVIKVASSRISLLLLQ